MKLVFPHVRYQQSFHEALKISSPKDKLILTRFETEELALRDFEEFTKRLVSYKDPSYFLAR
jgi:hypothetical protein